MTVVRSVFRARAAALAAAAVLSLVCLGGCGGTTSPSAIASAIAAAGTPPPASAVTLSAPPSEEPSSAATEGASESALPSAVPTDLDPCQLVTSADASSFVGVTFGPGKESTTDSNVRMCTYTAGTANIFDVGVAIAPDVATAKAAETALEKDLETQTNDLASLGLSVTKLPGFAAGADAAILQGGITAAGQSIAARAIFVLRGTTFFEFGDIALGGNPPSEQATKDKAMELLAKVP